MCVTGLIVETTMTHGSIFGQAVIILLVQIGGLGVITITTGMFFMLRKRITLGNRMLIQESMGLNTMTGLVPLVKDVYKRQVIQVLQQILLSGLVLHIL